MERTKLLGIGLGVLACLWLMVPTMLVEPGYAVLIVPPKLQMGERGSISELNVYQYVSGSWVLRGTVSASGGTIVVAAEQPVKFDLICVVDYYISGSGTCAGALTNTRAYIAITGEVSTTLMTQSSSCPGNIPDIVWYILFTYTWDASGKPVSGVTYTVTFTYQAYF